jgi:hypothetical protein
MNISDILNSPAANKALNNKSKTAAQETTSLSPLQQVIKKTHSKIQAEVETTTTQLSSFGRLKSALSNTQLAAHALGNLPSTASSADIKTAVQNFVGAFNTAMGTAKNTATAPGSTSATHSANRAGRDLGRALSSDFRTLDALRKLGVSMDSKGELTIDSKKLEAAQKTDPAGALATLGKIGRQVEKTAIQELAADGHVNGFMNSLNARASQLKTQQSALTSLAQDSTGTQGSTTPKTGIPSWSRGFGASVYQNSANITKNSWNA